MKDDRSDDPTITWDDPKFIRCEAECYYCFGNCDLCKIKFMCWAGNIEFDEPHRDEDIELKAFGNILGRIILHAAVPVPNKFHRVRYHGNQTERHVFNYSSLLYLNKNKMVCCKKRPRSVHHVKDWG
jgi:hypothetical protein